MLTLIVLLLIVMLIVGAAPVWPHSRAWGPIPSSGLGLVLLILLVLYLTGHVRL